MLFLAVCLLVACGDDDGSEVTTPNLNTEFCDMYINADSRAATITLDDGTVLDILSQGIRSNVADTTVRTVVTYAMKNVTPQIYSYNPAVCMEAKPLKMFKITPRDPVKVISVWRGGKYINMVLGELTIKDGTHSYGFLIDEVKNRKLCVSLIHYRPSTDAEAYTEKKYFSLPIVSSYVTDYDSIAISIPTYDGMKSYSFEVK